MYVYFRNFDVFLMGEEGVKRSYVKGNGDVGVIEGVMGLYDGIGVGEKVLIYDVLRILGNMLIVLVMFFKGQSLILCVEINGFKDYRNVNIVGVVLNLVSQKYYDLLKYVIE